MGMALAVAGLVSLGDTTVNDAGCIDDSFPGFAKALAALGAQVTPHD
jgi:3-phosphoshikimate 1-carboxyvinyltransferase